jgi:hypothetical protein
LARTHETLERLYQPKTASLVPPGLFAKIADWAREILAKIRTANEMVAALRMKTWRPDRTQLAPVCAANAENSDRQLPTTGGFMSAIRLPLSGDVTQTFNINVGESSDPSIEKDAICKASYGMQLGRIGDALIVLLRHIKFEHLSADEEKSIEDLKRMLHDIASVKHRHKAKHIIWP